MALRPDGTSTGTLGGGCVEAEVTRRALALLHRGESALLDFTLDHDYGWDDGLICGGRMQVAVMPVGADRVGSFEAALGRVRAGEAACVPVCVTHEGQLLHYRVHLEIPPTLVIAGAGHVGLALARLARDLDFRVVVIDDRADFASRARFGEGVELIVGDISATLRKLEPGPGAYVVIVTRGHRHDQAALEAVIRRPVAYLGMIGSRRKSRMILRDLAESGVERAWIERVHTPIGLAIGAVTVNEIAVSIAAELVQVRRRSVPRAVEGPLDTSSADAGADS